MKLAGFLLLPAGWVLVLAAVALLHSAGSRNAFAVAGFVVEMLGLALMFRAHMTQSGDGE